MTGTASSADLVRLIGEQAHLVRAICIFNENPADYIDESRRQEFFAGPVDEALWQSDRSRRHLSRHILERLGVQPCLDARRPEWPIALLERSRLDRLARHLAAFLVGSRVRRSVSRAEFLQWREWLSPDAHEFALTRAGLLPLNAAAGDPIDRVSALDLGRMWIAASARRWPEAIARRFMLKLPMADPSEADAVDGASASRLVSSVLPILESRWCSSFANMRI